MEVDGITELIEFKKMEPWFLCEPRSRTSGEADAATQDRPMIAVAKIERKQLLNIADDSTPRLMRVRAKLISRLLVIMTSFKTSFRFDTVAIIDSVPEDEEQTAVWLRDVIVQPLAIEHGIGIAYVRVENRRELLSAMSELALITRNIGLAPIVHLEGHGTEAGMQLANRDLVPWAEMTPWLRDLNRACRMNLLAVMSMCHGWHLVSQLQPVDQAPVWALIGPVEETLPARLQEAFQAFYPELLNALDARAALEAMNAKRSATKWELRIEVAELMFCKIWRRYERQLCTADGLKARQDSVVTQMVRHAGYDLRVALYARPLAQQYLENTEKSFAQFRRSFLMLDLFPDNEGRFAMSYRDCLHARADAN